MEGFSGFPFFNNSSSLFSSGSSSANNPTNDEATTKKIVEVVELLEKLANKGQFPLENLQEMKQELKRQYPNINFSTQNDSQTPTENTTDDHYFQNGSTFPNDPYFASNFINQLTQQQKLNNNATFQPQMISNPIVEQNMRMIGMPWNRTTYTTSANSAASNNNPYFGVTGNMNNQGTASHVAALTNSAGFGGDDSAATSTSVSFLGSFLGGVRF